MVDGHFALGGSLVVEYLQVGHHSDGGPYCAVRIVVMRDSCSEDTHHRITDELVEHSPFVGNAVDHDGEVVVEQLDGSLSAQLLGDRSKASDAGEQNGAHALLAPHDVGVVPVRSHQLVRQFRIHVTRHGGLHSFFGTDVLDHQHCADDVVFGRRIYRCFAFHFFPKAGVKVTLTERVSPFDL